MKHYSIVVQVQDGHGDHGSRWLTMHDEKMTRGTAKKLALNLAPLYPEVMVFAGSKIGHLAMAWISGVQSVPTP